MTVARVNLWAVALAAAATLLASAIYYIVLGGVWLDLRGLPADAASRPSPGELAGQYFHNFVIAVALAVLLRWTGTRTLAGALALGGLVWVGFQAMAVAGSVLHEHYPLGLYFLHIGDALMTTLIMVLILGKVAAR
ncbi:MAG: hypothetical protein AUI14_00055 [Actinobacteria bacterium 13_2_20CM_2_71_6]|nr:MAG: hypothetical protein AUI14_00055 [Actinobacteria bacterium 13_2_20CM_2_71_6]